MKRKPYQLPFHRQYNWQIWLRNHTHKIVLAVAAVLTAACIFIGIAYLTTHNEMLDAKLEATEHRVERIKLAVDTYNLFYFGAPKEGEEKIILTWKGKKIDY